MSATSFSKQTIGWYKSYLSNQLFRVNLEKCYSDPSNITCGVSQEFILGPLMFLIYVNAVSKPIKSNPLVYADDSCLVFQGNDVIEIEKQLNRDFTKICAWSVNNRLSIHFGEDKTKSIPIASERKIKVPKLSITYKNMQIKQNSKVPYLGCILDETMPGESMALKVINKIQSNLNFYIEKTNI